MALVYCSVCAKQIADSAPACPGCGAAQRSVQGIAGRSPKGFVATLLLAFFLGALGVHRFYVGKVWTGLLMFFTLGGFFIWQIVDVIMIAVKKFKDAEGRIVTA